MSVVGALLRSAYNKPNEGDVNARFVQVVANSGSRRQLPTVWHHGTPADTEQANRHVLFQGICPRRQLPPIPAPRSSTTRFAVNRAGGLKPKIWCGRGDLNPYVFRHWILNPARLPIPPLPLERWKA